MLHMSFEACFFWPYLAVVIYGAKYLKAVTESLHPCEEDETLPNQFVGDPVGSQLFPPLWFLQDDGDDRQNVVVVDLFEMVVLELHYRHGLGGLRIESWRILNRM